MSRLELQKWSFEMLIGIEVCLILYGIMQVKTFCENIYSL